MLKTRKLNLALMRLLRNLLNMLGNNCSHSVTEKQLQIHFQKNEHDSGTKLRTIPHILFISLPTYIFIYPTYIII